VICGFAARQGDTPTDMKVSAPTASLIEPTGRPAHSGRTEIRAGVALHAESFYRANGDRLVRHAIAWDGSTYLEMTRTLVADPT
jgi:hypothetical protein